MDPTLLNRVATGGPDGGNADRYPVAIEDRIYNIYPDLNPLVKLSTRAGKKSVGQQEFKVLEDRERPRKAKTNAGNLLAGSTVLTFDDGTRFRAKDQWQNVRTGEHVHTVSVSGNDVTVIRAYGTVAAAALLDDDDWQWVGNALEESANAVAALITKTSTFTNYCQYFDETTRLTEIESNVDLYGEDEQKRQREQGMRNIKLAVESAFWFGQPLKDIEGSSPVDTTAGIDTRYKTGGVKYFIDTNASSNVLDASGAITLMDLWDWTGKLTEKAPMLDKTNIVLFGGRQAIAALDMLAIDKVELASNQNEFGFSLQKIRTHFGTLDVVYHSLFNDNYSDYLFGINPNFLGYRHLNNMDIKMRVLDMNDSTGGHELKDEFWGVIGLWLGGAELHGYIKNVETAL
jgi:hypothetical protein